MTSSAKLLVINADDFGYCDERNRGIIECFQKGGVSSASLMVNAAAVKSACSLASQCGLPVGLHLNLTEGKPVKTSRKYKTLVEDDGCFLGKFGLQRALDQSVIDMSEVREEIRAQIELFEQYTGHLPVHVDGHQHAHVFPGICQVFAEELSHKGIQITRLPDEYDLDHSTWVDQARFQFYKTVCSHAQNASFIFKDFKIRFTRTFIGMALMSRDNSIERLQQRLKSAFNHITTDDGSEARYGSIAAENEPLPGIELMVHPGYACLTTNAGCGAGPDDFSRSPDRHYEMVLLNSRELKLFYEKHNIQCLSFLDLLKSCT